MNIAYEKKLRRTVQTITNRFETYGYERMNTSALESYELFSNMQMEMNLSETLKITNYNGELLVLRPDVTLPLTYRYADLYTIEQEPYKRYYYNQPVYRQSFSDNEAIEKLQVGIECFEESSTFVDAEVIALAAHTLQDLGIESFTFEIGYAKWLERLLEGEDLSKEAKSKMQSLIESKNKVELETYLETLDLSKEVSFIVSQIPTNYGTFSQLEEQLTPFIAHQIIKETLTYLGEIESYLKIYGLEDQIIFDLGLINQMDYYSDIVFQAFVEGVGQPVLMGGRYNQLGQRFGQSFPAIGFAFEIDHLIEAVPNQKSDQLSIEVAIVFEEGYEKEAIAVASELRRMQMEVVLGPPTHLTYTAILWMGSDHQLQIDDEMLKADLPELIQTIKRLKGAEQ